MEFSTNTVNARSGHTTGNLTDMSSPILQDINLLVQAFEARRLSREDAITDAKIFIDKLYGYIESDISLARYGLCCLLGLNIEETQKEVFYKLKPLFNLTFLSNDVKKKQTQPIISLEKHLSKIMELHIRSNFCELTLFFLDAYIDILERLWLLPHLDNQNCSALNEYIPEMKHKIESWLVILSKESLNNQSLKQVLIVLQEMMRRITISSPLIITKVKKLGPEINNVTIFTSLGKVYCETGNPYRACRYPQV